MNSLLSSARHALLQLPEVTKLSGLRRSTSLFAQGQRADCLYIIEEGLVKLTRTNEEHGRIILCISGPDHVVGEEALLTDASPAHYAEAEVLTTATVYQVPREALVKAVTANGALAIELLSSIARQKSVLAEKAELLCLHDVEYRILHYLAELPSLLKPSPNGEGYQLPITQLELADLIGATRETTSTTLNQLERRGLIRLSRRLLIIPSPDRLRDAAQSKHAVPATQQAEAKMV